MTSPLRICLATQNPHKVEELRALLQLHAPELQSSFEIVSLTDLGIFDEVVEDGADFVANAKLKAQAAHARTGLWSLADDSGLEVAALGGAPGLYSARYGGTPRPGQSRDARNREALLEALREVPESDRQARFVCVLYLCGPATSDGASPALWRRGECRGQILFSERGEGGFGYDSLFVPTADELVAAKLEPAKLGKTYAELSEIDKNQLSHRARALCALRPNLAALTDCLPA